MLAVVFMAAMTTGCERRDAPLPDTEPVEHWSPERIAADPNGYLEYADRLVQQQVESRQQRLQTLAARRADIERRSGELLERVEEAGNLARRLTTAIERAEDENRWPLVFAGKSFPRDRAQTLLTAIREFEKQREPLAAAYRDALQRIAHNERAMRDDIANLARTREQLALDLERVRLNQGMAELAELRKTEARLANLGSTLAGLDEDPLAGFDDGAASLDVNELLK